jgi:hypothetical protein
MPPDVATRVAAVALFGKPNERFMRAIRQPAVDVGPSYADKTIELCVSDDFVCSSGRDFNAHTQYVETGLVDEAAVFAAARIALATPPPVANPQGPQGPSPAGQPHLPTPAAPPLSTIPVAPPPPTAAAQPQPHLQRSPETIDSCATECRVVGPV